MPRSAHYFANLRAEEARRNQAAFGGRRSRSAASSLYPYLSTNSRDVAASLTRPQGSLAQRMYPTLPSSSQTRIRRRTYGDEY
jgi:hypothetical protein